MKFKNNKLRGKIKEVFGSEREFAKNLGIGYNTLSGKINNKYEWKQSEIYKASKILNIPVEEIPTYFFEEEK